MYLGIKFKFWYHDLFTQGQDHTSSEFSWSKEQHSFKISLLPPAYIVRWEGNSFTLFVSPHLGGVPISHNALQHYPECHGADTWRGYPYAIMLCNISQNSTGQTPRGVPSQVQLMEGYPARSGWGVPCWGVPC